MSGLPGLIASYFLLIHWPMLHFFINGAPIWYQILLSCQTVYIVCPKQQPRTSNHHAHTRRTKDHMSHIRRHTPPLWWTVKYTLRFRHDAVPVPSAAHKVLCLKATRKHLLPDSFTRRVRGKTTHHTSKREWTSPRLWSAESCLDTLLVTHHENNASLQCFFSEPRSLAISENTKSLPSRNSSLRLLVSWECVLESSRKARLQKTTLLIYR